jgi:hypothetical protein
MVLDQAEAPKFGQWLVEMFGEPAPAAPEQSQ